jgi:hypothetical protein
MTKLLILCSFVSLTLFAQQQVIEDWKFANGVTAAEAGNND